MELHRFRGMAEEPAYTVASDSETSVEEKPQNPFKDVAIGIDLGTSQCSVAFWNGSHIELIRNTRNQKLLRSFVTFGTDHPPSAGVSNQLSHEYEMLTGATIFNMKRLVGRLDTDPIVHASKNLPFLVQSLDIGVRPFIAALVKNMWRSTTPEEVLAIFLVELRAMAEVHLKRPVTNVVLTVPVCFSRFQLSRIERACAMAGLHVLRLMPEPTAVALMYAQQQQENIHDNMGSGSEKNALIFNMGAGYCDVAVTATAGGVSQIKALAGDAIGGEDILQNMMHHLVPEMDNLFSRHGMEEISKLGLLRVATQDTIHRLSFQESFQIDIDLGDERKINKLIDRNEFESVNLKVFDKCESLIRRCLHDAKLEIGNLDDVILVGGCSYIPKIKDMLMSVCKKKDLYPEMHPLEAAVRGAAMEGAVASGIIDPSGSLDLLTIQATPLSIGIRADANTFVPIIQQNTAIPARRELFFTTVHDNQAEALVVVYEGDEKDMDEEKNKHLLGYFKITGIPAAPKGVPEITVCMDIDAGNVLRVYAGVVMPGAAHPAAPFMEVRMPTVDDGHGWCAESLNKSFGSTIGLVIAQKKVQA